MEIVFTLNLLNYQLERLHHPKIQFFFQTNNKLLKGSFQFYDPW